MWILVLMFLLAVPAWAEDLGELSANPAGLSGFSGSFGFFGCPIRQPNERDKLNKPFLGPANQTDQIDQTNEIDQFDSPYSRGLRIEGR